MKLELWGIDGIISSNAALLAEASHTLETKVYHHALYNERKTPREFVGIVHYNVMSQTTEDVRKATSAALDRLSKPEALNNSLGAVERSTPLLEPLLKFLGRFADSLRVFSEIHPYAKAAYEILLGAYEVYKVILEERKSIHGLFRAMFSMDDILFAGDRLKVSEHSTTTDDIHQRKILLYISQQTNECAYFIRDYCFRSRMQKVKQFFDDTIAERIELYTNQFVELKEQFLREGVVEVQLATSRLIALAEDTNSETYIQQLSRVDGASLGSTDKLCLEGTRTALLNEIYTWINADPVSTECQQPRILLLTGDTGAGKSFIAHTVARHFEELRHLGGSFTFGLPNGEGLRSEQVYIHIARHLTALDKGIKRAVADGVANYGGTIGTCDPETHFEKFVVDPLKRETPLGPVVIIIDGLNHAAHHVAEEENDNPLSEKLARVLLKFAHQLPAQVRIVVTTRLTSGLRSIFKKNPSCYHHVDMHTKVHREETFRDICKFLFHRLDQKRRLSRPIGYVDETKRRIIAASSKGDFSQAARTMDRIIDPWAMPHDSMADRDIDPWEKEIIDILKEAWPSASE
ncbi:hypothetical protein EIP86_011451 [Pleurotus ostreatoroseus]|nr:hypothetical protein EIP86_011451 [Pleurotus ostreatoroseus]